MTDTDLTIGANIDDSTRSTPSSATVDQTSAHSGGSNDHESDAVNREAVSPESEDGSAIVFNFNKSFRQQQKSVCFHSVTSGSGEKKVTNGKIFRSDSVPRISYSRYYWFVSIWRMSWGSHRVARLLLFTLLPYIPSTTRYGQWAKLVERPSTKLLTPFTLRAIITISKNMLAHLKSLRKLWKGSINTLIAICKTLWSCLISLTLF